MSTHAYFISHYFDNSYVVGVGDILDSSWKENFKIKLLATVEISGFIGLKEILCLQEFLN